MAAPAAMQREAVGLAVMAVLALLGGLVMLRLLPAGDEGRQPVDVAFGGCVTLLRRPRLMRLVLLMRREGLCVARDIRLRLARAVGRFASTAHVRLSLVVAVLERVVARSVALRTGEVRIVLPELLLRRGDHAIVMLGVLVVVFRRDRVAGRVGIACELEVFLRDVGC